MSISIKQTELKIKDQNGNYVAQDLFLNESSEAKIAEINAAGAAALNNIPASFTATLEDIAPIYSTSATYSIGDYVIHNGILYRCKTNINTPEPTWSASKWQKVNLGEELADSNSTLRNILDAELTNPEKAAQAKATGDRIRALEQDVNENIHTALDDIIDDTLSITNKAAEAETVGNRFATNEQDISDLQNTVNNLVDNTLTQSGKAADAATVGNKFATDENNIDNLTNIVNNIIDNTLSISGKGADAAATGNQIQSVRNSLTSLGQTVTEQNNRITSAETIAQNARQDINGLTAPNGIITELQQLIGEKVASAQVEDGYLILLDGNGDRIGRYGPFAGSGGGGSGPSIENDATLTLSKIGSWINPQTGKGITRKSIASNSATCPITFTWSSIDSDDNPTEDGILTVSVNGIQRLSLNIPQGDYSVDVIRFLQQNTSNRVEIRITDEYENTKFFRVTIQSVNLQISSSFDHNIAYISNITFPYVPIGVEDSVNPITHFYLDGVQIGTQSINQGYNNQYSYIIPLPAHGGHVLQVYFSCEVQGQTIESNHLKYNFISLESGNRTPIIVSSFDKTTVQQYETLNIDYKIYNPRSETSNVQIIVNGQVYSEVTTNNETRQVFTYRPNYYGNLLIIISSGSVSKTFDITVTQSQVTSAAVTQNLALYLNSAGRSNNEARKNIWQFTDEQDNTISAQFSNFKFVADGWHLDNINNSGQEIGSSILRIKDNARLIIPFNPFASVGQTSANTTGKTIELEFSTSDIKNYNSTVISCTSGSGEQKRGFWVTSQEAFLKTDSNQISIQFKENEHVRITFTIDKISGTDKLILIYVNGVMSRALQYTSDNFIFNNISNITMGSNDCTLNLYCIRIYNSTLTRQQVLDNWIADTQDIDLMLARWRRNQVFDNGNIVANKLPSDLPYMIINSTVLPQNKSDDAITGVSGSFTNPANPSKNFTFTGCELSVQGTSSAVYTRKNYDMKFKSGFTDANGNHIDNYALGDDSVPFNRFVIKADVASSESTNNTGLTCYFNDIDPYKYPEQLEQREDSYKIRQGIYGFPIVLFWYNPNTGRSTFMGKYNFNHPKRAAKVYGFSGTMESWEWQNNVSDRMLFKSDDFAYDPQDIAESAWRSDFEARFPKDTWGIMNQQEFAEQLPDITYMTPEQQILQLKTFISWVKSTDRTVPQAYYQEHGSYQALPNSVTLRDRELVHNNGYSEEFTNKTFTHDTPEYRLTKFRAELSQYMELESAVFYYIFTQVLLMIDSRAKNMFPSFCGSNTGTAPNIRRKVVFLPYDMDTAIGTNNEGILAFGWNLEDTDQINNTDVFNGQQSVLWCNLRDGCPNDIARMYSNLRSSGNLSYNSIENMYEERQSKWPEAVFNEDAYFKYILPGTHNVTEGNTVYTADVTYLTMLQGSKAEQRKWWLSHRFPYMDSKWDSGDAARKITIRANMEANSSAVDNPIVITPYNDIYATVTYASVHKVTRRAQANTPIALPIPANAGISHYTDTEISIHSAKEIASLGDLSAFRVSTCLIGEGQKLQEIILGSNENGYTNPNLTNFSIGNDQEGTLGNNRLLKLIDIRNCVNYQGSLNLNKCVSIEEVYADNTKVTGVVTPKGGVLNTLHLPATVNNIEIYDQPQLSDLEIAGYSNLRTIKLSSPNTTVKEQFFNILDTISESQILQIQITNIDMQVDSIAAAQELYQKLKRHSGGLLNNIALEDPYIIGTLYIHGDTTGSQIAALEEQFPNIKITSERNVSYLHYMSWDGTIEYGTVRYVNGVAQDMPPAQTLNLTRAATEAYTFSFIGWNLEMDESVDERPGIITNIQTETYIYAAFTKIPKTYTVTWKDSNNIVLQTDSQVPYGTMPTFNGTLPENFVAWTPKPKLVTGNIIYTVSEVPVHNLQYYVDNRLVYTAQGIPEGTLITGTVAENWFNGDKATLLADSQNKTRNTNWWLPTDFNITQDSKVWAQYNQPKEVALITDDWDTIFANIDNGTYRQKYKIGNYKPIIFNNSTTINMQIAAFNKDFGSQTKTIAPISWISIQLLNTLRPMNNTSQQSYYKIKDSNISWRQYTSATSYVKWITVNQYCENSTAHAKWTWNFPNLEDSPTYNVAISYYLYNTSTDELTIKVGSQIYLDKRTQSANWTKVTSNNIMCIPGTSLQIEAIFEKKDSNYNYAMIQVQFFEGNTNTAVSFYPQLSTLQQYPSKERYQYGYYSGTGAIGGWAVMPLRSYLASIRGYLPSNIISRIIQVNKKHTALKEQFSTNSTSSMKTQTQTTQDYLWIPTTEELSSGLNGFYYTLFPNSSSREKHQPGLSNNVSWWTRTPYNYYGNYYNAHYTNNSYFDEFTVTNNLGVILCFCT